MDCSQGHVWMIINSNAVVCCHQVMETAVSRKKRMILTARELEAQRAAGPASNRGFLRSLVASVTRPAQRSAADTLAALRAEVSQLSEETSSKHCVVA
jgi:hypothetical protein